MLGTMVRQGRQAQIQIYTTDRRHKEREVENRDLGLLLVKLHLEELLDSLSLMPQ